MTPTARLRQLAIDLALTVLIGVPVLGWLGHALDDYSATRDRIRAAQARERFERAAQAVCGENAGWREIEPGQIQCFTHRGHKTVRVTL